MKSNTQSSGKSTKKKHQNSDPEVIETDFGDRTISKQNSSRIVALPLPALMNCGLEAKMKVNVKLVQQKGEKFLKLTPKCVRIEDSQ